MIISRTTSDAVLVASVQVVGTTGKTLHKLVELDTDTLQAKDSHDVVKDVRGFYFFGDTAQLTALLPETLQRYIVPGLPNKQSMVWGSDDPDLVFEYVGLLQPALMRCSGCDAHFLVYLERSNIWSPNKTNAANKHFTLTQLDKESLTCDGCGQPVRLVLR